MGIAGSNGGSSGGGGSGASGASGSQAPGASCGPVPSKPRCLDDGWCWDGPGVIGGTINAIDGTESGSSVFAVGANGAAFRRCGDHWYPIDTGVSAELFDVWHPRDDFALAVGANGTVLRWDGKRWEQLPAPTDLNLHAVWGRSENEVWVGGDTDEVFAPFFMFDGSTFEEVNTDVAMSLIRTIHGHGDKGLIVLGGIQPFPHWAYFDGTSWSRGGWTGLPDPDTFASGMVAPDGAVYATTGSSSFREVYRWDGKQPIASDGAWVETIRTEQGQLAALFMEESGKPAIVHDDFDRTLPGKVMTFDGMKWTENGDQMVGFPTEVWRGPELAFAVGYGGMLLEPDADRVWRQTADVPLPAGTPLLITGTSDDAATMVTTHDVYARDQRGWRFVAHQDEEISQASVDREGRVYTFGAASGPTFAVNVRRFDGTSWVSLPECTTGTNLVALAPDDIYVFGNGARHFDGKSWTELSGSCANAGSTVQHVAPDGGLWIGFARGVAKVESDGTTWTCDEITNYEDDTRDFGWSSSGELWLIGYSGGLYQQQGDRFVLRRDVLQGVADFNHSVNRVKQLLPAPDDTLRVVFDGKAHPGWLEGDRFVTVKLDDVSAGDIKVSAPVSGPGIGQWWVAPSGATYELLPGGVVRRED